MRLLSLLQSVWTLVAPWLRVLLPPAGVVLMVLAAGFALHSWNFARHRIRAVGVVTENVTSFAPSGGVVYAPRIRFRFTDGTTLQPVLGPASEAPEFAPGTAVPVLYLSGQPQSALIATTGRAYTAAIWFGVWGIVLLDAGLILNRFAKPRAA